MVISSPISVLEYNIVAQIFLNAAIPRLIESNRYETARHIYVGIGGRINISKLYSLRPNLLLKHSKNLL